MKVYKIIAVSSIMLLLSGCTHDSRNIAGFENKDALYESYSKVQKEMQYLGGLQAWKNSFVSSIGHEESLKIGYSACDKMSSGQDIESISYEAYNISSYPKTLDTYKLYYFTAIEAATTLCSEHRPKVDAILNK